MNVLIEHLWFYLTFKVNNNNKSNKWSKKKNKFLKKVSNKINLFLLMKITTSVCCFIVNCKGIFHFTGLIKLRNGWYILFICWDVMCGLIINPSHVFNISGVQKEWYDQFDKFQVIWWYRSWNSHLYYLFIGLFS